MTGEAPRVIAITDCGSTTTKAILIERVAGVYRMTCRGDAPTTVEAPVEDVTRGVVAALEDLSAMSGRQILDDDGRIIRPAEGARGVDLYLSTSSAGGGLQMAVAGVFSRISAESAERAALGAGAIVADVVSCDDDRPLFGQIERLRALRPDMVLLSGGVDGGADVQVVEMAELIAAADPRPRFGADFKLPVIFAGNAEVQSEIRDTLAERCELTVVDNVRPSIDEERLGPAREKIHDLFLDHVMRQAPGFARLVRWTDAPVAPTPSAVGDILRATSDEEELSVVAVDIGGATTDIFSVVGGAFNRTVSANLGLSYSAANVLAECGSPGMARWIPEPVDPEWLRNLIMNKTVRPTTIPDTLEELLVEQALAREALRLSFAHHRSFATGLKGGHGDREAGSGPTTDSAEVGFSLLDIDLIIGSGGVLSHAPRSAQTAAMLIDSFLPEGVTRLAKDSIFMLPHLGVLLGVHPGAARSVFERDCVEPLGTCVAPTGPALEGKPLLELRLERAGEPPLTDRLVGGELRTLPLALGEEATLIIEPSRKHDVGTGRGKRWSGVVTGGPLGLILDGRGRPLAWPADAPREKVAARWLEALGALDAGGRT